MTEEPTLTPDPTAVRVALWRAMHVQIDPPPHVFEDEIGLQLASPPDGWRKRPDMDPQGTAPYRAAIVARARFVEDLVSEQAAQGARQYVILGAGLDTFAERRRDLASTLHVFEVDRPGPQAWKRQRLIELGFGVPDGLHLVPVDFEGGSPWWDRLIEAGFDATRPAIVVSTGVSMYITKEATAATLRQMSALAPGSILATTFLLPLELTQPEEQAMYERTQKAARASGTPFISFFSPDEMTALARRCGFREARHVSTAEMVERYFAGRTDGLRPSTGEQMVIATV
jgi:methyltransferase (TIGR00027 family)